MDKHKINNTLALFVGFEFYPADQYDGAVKKCASDPFYVSNIIPSRLMPFTISFDWLVPVIRKIKEIEKKIQIKGTPTHKTTSVILYRAIEMQLDNLNAYELSIACFNYVEFFNKIVIP